MKTTQSITRRYSVALALIAAVLVFSHALMSFQIARNKADGYIINISGMQRMLSQRIALLANELATAKDAETTTEMATKLTAAHDKMRSNQAELHAAHHSAISTELQDLYYGSGQVDQSVNDYLTLAEQVLDAHQQQPQNTAAVNESSRKLALIARNGFLNRLDSVVLQYQTEFEQRIVWFQRIQWLFLIVGLITLLLEAFIIFRPMTQHVAATVEKLEKSNLELQEFAYRISHDLRAPIASSRGIISMVQESIAEGDVEFASDGIGRVSTAMERLDGLISDVIAVTKNRQIEFEPEVFPLSTMVAEAVESLDQLPDFERLKIVQQIDPDLLVQTHRILLKQCLENLVSNAIKYSDFTKQQPEIIIKAVQTGSFYEIHVADNGVGVPVDSRAELFGMFKRFHPRQSFGSGLGLYLVKQNIERLGGSIRYEPLPQGSVFVVKISMSCTETHDAT